jgi:calcineurin-like phosphoesterase family protein
LSPRSAVVLVLALVVLGSASPSQARPIEPAASAADPVIAGAGDISCPSGPDGSNTCRDGATAGLLRQIDPAYVIALGDNQYEKGTLDEYDTYYAQTWGDPALKSRTMPTPGNHEYKTPGAAGYFDYFGSVAASGYYSFDVGEWHVLSLDSEIPSGKASSQYQWASADLNAHLSTACVMAYWHKARWGSGGHGSLTKMLAIWNLLYNRRADLVLVGHNHQYERFAPLNKMGQVDLTRGMREFVVGSGGKNLDAFGPPITGSEFQDNTHFGVLKLTLHGASYDWEFVAEPDGVGIDWGTQACH